MKKLTAHNVIATMNACLYTDEEVAGGPPADAVIVECIGAGFGLHPDRVQANKQDIADMLRQLPEDFQSSGGGGASFLNMCQTADGEQWTGEHKIMEALCALGIAAGLASFPLGRDFWATLPGSMPYVTVWPEVVTAKGEV